MLSWIDTEQFWPELILSHRVQEVQVKQKSKYIILTLYISEPMGKINVQLLELHNELIALT